MNSNNNWLEFKEIGWRARRMSPRVYLTKDRHFRFNQKALDLIGSPKAVRFLFDVGLSRIGIRAVDPEAPHSFDVRNEPNGKTSIVYGALFCDHMGIRPENTIEFHPVRTDDEGTLLLDLTTARRKLSSNTAGK